MRDYSFRSYETLSKSAEYINSKIKVKPEIALVLGSALGSLIDDMIDPVIINYEDIPGFLVSTVDDHAGKLYVGNLYGKNVLCMAGRFHYYEGYDFEELSIPFRVMKLLGIKNLILTNAAGAVNENYSVGDIVVIQDTIKLMGGSPLRGINDERFGPRFQPVDNMFDREWKAEAYKIGIENDIPVKEGVYFFFPGPQFETPAEIRAARILGGDCVGMSTVPDAISAYHCGIKVLGLSLMTNMAAGVKNLDIRPGEVSEAGRNASDYFKKYLKLLLERK